MNRTSLPLSLLTLVTCLTTISCKHPATPPATKQASLSNAAVHIRPRGDETIAPDLSKTPPDLKKVYDYIDAHIDDHVVDFQKWIQQPSISNSGEGIPESAEMVKGFFDKLGCQTTRVYDVGITEYGTPGNPVVYAKCDEGAPRTLVLYWMYDTMPVTQADAWIAPPFEGRIVDGKTAGIDPMYKKVLIGRGATNSKGPQLAQLEALMSMRATMGKLPVNIIVVAEGDEERMDIGLRKFVKDHPELFKGADAMLRFNFQGAGGTANMSGGSEGCVYVELTTSGKAWGKGPTVSDIHGSWKRSVDSPAWRHIKMLGTLVSDDGNTPKIAGFFDNMQPLSPTETAGLRQASQKLDLKKAADNLGVGRYISDDPFTMLKMSRYGTSFNLDGIWGGNMYAGGAGAILPNKITSKHNFRYIPNMNGLDLVKKLRAQLDKNGYKDVDMKLIGDVPWAKMRYDTDIAAAVAATFDEFGIQYQTPTSEETILGGYWPAYLFASSEVGQRVAPVTMPIAAGELGSGGRAHAANEYYILEGAGKTYGLAGAEKSTASIIYNFGHGVRPKTMPTPPAAPTK
ncbi:M20/M25/M40 family metallo-hydrolase [Terriglobus roseus]|uniref:Acetylornithine deacetylase/Succinyl-diaminopimelate desuccinylase n=1 Tax=Terriglobus roseus TaxID=392734 RepID=A0A1H4U547_9BACT|nr:M20/M25/M40 family metallo-hydrolase [Terriglobus roseus]SEC63856.1 Acetylornithine deacetylase/Succinyl-diaminopimelate desuccinylase [Terriglobus roseus]